MAKLKLDVMQMVRSAEDLDVIGRGAIGLIHALELAKVLHEDERINPHGFAANRIRDFLENSGCVSTRTESNPHYDTQSVFVQGYRFLRQRGEAE